MLKTVSISDTSDLILSYGECGYQEVLDSFCSATRIRILTYNISTSDDTLLRMLSDIGSEVNIKIISNIPNRFDSYFTPTVRDRARRTITTYLDTLNPDNFSAGFSAFFNFSNHSKIIMTDSIAYIGSANFSGESSRNFECGVLIRDLQIIEQIEREFFESIQEHSVEFRGTAIARIYVRAIEILSRVQLVIEAIRWSMYREIDLPFRGIQYKSFAPELSTTDLNELAAVIEDLEEVITDLEENERYNHIAHIIPAQLLTSIRELIEIDSPIYNLATFDEQEYAENYMEDFAAWADEENLDRFANSASQESADKHTDLALQAEADIERLLATLDGLVNDLDRIISCIGSCDEQEPIDNT